MGNGYAYFEDTIWRPSFDRNERYQVAIMPTIYKVSPNKGTGQNLNINGTGFVTNSSRIKVSVDGRNCEIKKAETNKIQCRLN